MLASSQDMLPVLKSQEVDQVVIAMPDAAGKTIRGLLALCEKAAVNAKTVPSLAALLDDRVSINQLRNVDKKARAKHWAIPAINAI